MPLFHQVMKVLAERRNLRRTLDGSWATYRLKLHGTAVVTVTTDELNPLATASAHSEPWPVPVTSGAYGEFMRVALNFNRNALHHLPCGILQDPANPSLYRLMWRIPAVDRSEPKWQQQLRLFGVLADKAWSTMPLPGGNAIRTRDPDDAQHVIFMP